MERGNGLSEARRTTGLGAVAALLLVVACTVGEVRPERPSAPDAEGPAADTAAAVDTMAVGDETFGATDLLTRSRLAYDGAELEEALALAEQVLAEYPTSGTAEEARWLAARTAFAMERYAQAEELASRYAEEQPSGSTDAEEARELARLAEDALAEPASTPAVVGAILPRSGPRVLVRYADYILQGIELAVAEVERRQGRPIELVVVDDSGGAGTRSAVAELERRGALAVVGPLLPRNLPAAVEARRDPRLVLVSPTATRSPSWPEAYSVSTGDTRGAQELGRYAADVGFTQAALLYARGRQYEQKAQAFSVEYETLGGHVRARVPYDSGTTTFGPHMEQILAAVAPSPSDTFGVERSLAARLMDAGLITDPMAVDTLPADSLLTLIDRLSSRSSAQARENAGAWAGRLPQRPFALFVAAPQQDVPKIAPQVAFYGLDSAGVQVFGDEAWASAQVRRVVPRRDLERVIAASHFPPGRADEAADPEFVQLYESSYRRSLDSSLPALGYDAANLVLQALPNRMLTPDAVAVRFGFLAAIRGATGMLSVRGGRVVRTPYVVMIRDGSLEPAPQPWEYEMPVPVPPEPDSGDGGR